MQERLEGSAKLIERMEDGADQGPYVSSIRGFIVARGVMIELIL